MPNFVVQQDYKSFKHTNYFWRKFIIILPHTRSHLYLGTGTLNLFSRKIALQKISIVRNFKYLKCILRFVDY